MPLVEQKKYQQGAVFKHIYEMKTEFEKVPTKYYLDIKILKQIAEISKSFKIQCKLGRLVFKNDPVKRKLFESRW